MKSFAFQSPILFAAVLFVLISASCADFWHDVCNSGNPPPSTPIAPNPGRTARAVQAVSEAEAVQKMTQKIIMRFSGKSGKDFSLALAENDASKPRMLALYENLLKERIASSGFRFFMREDVKKQDSETTQWTVSIVDPSGSVVFSHSIPIRTDAP